MPVTMNIGHESALMGPRVGVPYSVRIEMTGGTGWVGTLGVMARSAAFNIAPGQSCMEPAARSDSDRHKSRLLMGQRPELKLVDIASGHVAC
jgi:hypothetical protein